MKKTKEFTNEQKIRKAVKAVEDLGMLAPAILIERLQTLFEMNIRDIKANPTAYNNPIFNHHQYLKVCETFLKHLKGETEL